MDRLEELKNKYKSVLDTIQQQGVRLAHVHIKDNKLFLQGTAPSEDAKNAVWNQIKAVDAGFSDLTCDLTVDTSLAQPAPAAPQQQTYTVQSGDTLSKISKQFYGNANDYMKIFEANRNILSDPNKIQVGQQLVIPA